MERETTVVRHTTEVKHKAYHFNGEGIIHSKQWDLSEARGREFCWYHVELPTGKQELSQSAQYLHDTLKLKTQDILSLISNGPFCGYVDGALVFRVNPPGPASSDFTFRIAGRVTASSVISVSLGCVPGLEFSSHTGQHEESSEGGTVIQDWEVLLRMNRPVEADNPVPKSVSNLVVHIIVTHVDQLQGMVTKLEQELDAVEIELDKGSFALKKQMLDERRFPKMHLNLQRLLQVIAQGEQVFPGVKENVSKMTWFASKDTTSLQDLTERLRRLKVNVGFIAKRVTALQAGLDSWQAEQINRKLYYLTILSIIFLPLSIITGVFGMNVGGIPWTEQKDPKIKHGFRNWILLCVVMLFIVVLLYFAISYLFSRNRSWRRSRA